MGKLKYLGVAVLIVLLMGAAVWLVTFMKSEEFVYKDNGMLHWIEMTSRNGKIKGTYHQKEIIDEIGEVPFIEEKKYSFTGKTTENGFELVLKSGGENRQFDASYSEGDLFFREHGKSDAKLFQSIRKKELDDYEKELQEELQVAIDESEEKFKSFIRTFFSELKSIYGYLYTAENGEYQLFVKIDEALLEGELSGSLLMMQQTGEKNNPYEEIRYELNGITDGHMLQFYTTVDGKSTKMKGNFHGDASSFDLSFWEANQKLTFNAVTKEQFKKNYDEFKAKVQGE
ncbi:hypothetical protein ACFFF5_06410 [Lederbergia wuyishanensis]|uniref:Uncharacterized protein n=1 Tax=Lederbergia wuyishanensis TaxID=1347903 RepID=A0ABU0D2Y5_9BACI|nr:hypothetical protein [Lederbergia wuyishanensis]MCJ8007122.1 hypothetical protein [Lederbergia wuyishanensis]MDQ0342733.1 hypothetical protein [Lederbergia wuyishanensis]